MNKILEALREIESIGERITFNEKHKLGKVDYQWIREIICKNTKIIEKSLKALKIIKAKQVDIYWLIKSKDLNEYNVSGYRKIQLQLTQEEYDLLREVLL